MKLAVFFAVFTLIDGGFGCNPLRQNTTHNHQPQSVANAHRRSMTRLPIPPNRGPLIWQDEFDHLNVIYFDFYYPNSYILSRKKNKTKTQYSKWTPMISGWRGSNAFQYYANRSENMYVTKTNWVECYLCRQFILSSTAMFTMVFCSSNRHWRPIVSVPNS